MSESQSPAPHLLGIKEVSQKTGLPASTIRYYDQQFSEFLDVKRGAGRRRLFSPESVDRLLAVHRMLKEEGLSMRQARQALSGGQGAPDMAPPEGLAQCQAEISRLKEQVAELDRKLGEMKEIQRRTLTLVDSLTR